MGKKEPDSWELGATPSAEVLGRGQRLAQSLRLVRVVFPWSWDEDRARRDIPDVSHRRRLRTLAKSRITRQFLSFAIPARITPRHESPGSRAKDKTIAGRSFAYFHAGRAHKDYGRAFIILSDFPSGSKFEASPFGIGALACTRCRDECTQASPPRCLVPVSHFDPITEQQKFYKDGCWPGEEWRERAGHYLARYFEGSSDRYFGCDSSARPVCDGPQGVFSRQTDWRMWTIEVRLEKHLDLAEAFTQKLIVKVGIPRTLLREVRALERQGSPTEREARAKWLPSTSLASQSPSFLDRLQQEGLLMTEFDDHDIVGACDSISRSPA